MNIFDKFIRWCDKTPTVSGPTKEEIRKATKRLERKQQITKTVYGGSHVERPPRTDKPQLPKIPNYNPNDIHYTMWNYEPISLYWAPLPPTAEDMLHKGYINQLPSHWTKELKEKIPPQIKKDIMKEIEWEYSEEGAKELRHIFAMYHLNDKVWQSQRRKAINLAVYGMEDPFNEKPYWHLISFNNEFGYKLVQYPIYEEDHAKKMYKEAQKAVNNGIISEVKLIKGYQED